MAKMTAAVAALDLYTLAIRVRQPGDRAGDLIVERRPPASRVELVLGAIEFGFATATCIGAFLEEVIVRACERRLCAFELDDGSLLRGEWIERFDVHNLYCTPAQAWSEQPKPI